MIFGHRSWLLAVFGLSVAAGVASQAIPVISSCPEGNSPVFLLQHNTTYGISLREVPTSSFIDCSELCAAGNRWAREGDVFDSHSAALLMRVLDLPWELAADCALLRRFNRRLADDLQDCVGVEYHAGRCRLIGAAANKEVYEPVFDEASLATKTCVKSARVCHSPFHFDVKEQKILVGFAREVVPADSIQVCLSACLNAFETFGFECESVMYYPVDSECILNTEDRLDRPDLFVDEHEDTVIYLDNNCAGSQCYAPYVTQYVAVENRQLVEELDRTFHDLTLEECEQICTERITVGANDFNCKSFMYNAKNRTCIVSDERSKPLGRGNLTEAIGFNYFEKKCFASPRTCRNTASFTRVPQMLLVGFAAFVMENVPSVTMCLDQCTNPPPETGENFVCKSAMYYYNEQECILNAESRESKPELFIPEEDDFLVDYFDINCHLQAEKCPAGKDVSVVRSLNAALPEGEGPMHVIESLTGDVQECAKKCFGMAPEKCRSFNYDKDSKLCNLLYLDGKTTLRPQVKSGVDLYDLHCLSPAPTSCQAKDPAQFSRYLYTKQPGLPTEELSVVSLSTCLEKCASSERCEGVNYNRRSGDCALFATIEKEVGAPHDHVDFYKNLCQVKEVDSGASSAANVPKEEIKESSGHAFNKTRHPILEQSQKKPSLKEKEEARFAPLKEATSETEQPILPDAKLDVKATGHIAPTGPPVLVGPEAVHTICNYEGIKVQIKNDKPFSGVVFVKNKYDTCRVEIGESDSATLVLGLPHDFGMKPILLNALATDEEKAAELKLTKEKLADNEESTSAHGELAGNEIRRKRQATRDCGIQDMNNGTYKTTVVVQTNNLGIPGLVTSMDQIYEISCDYSSMLGGKVTTAANMTVHGPTPSLIQPRGKIELGNPVMMQMSMANSTETKPVIHAKLGDILELHWEIMAMDEELDFFVRDCYAEAGGKERREDEKLQLIEEGCPTPAVAQKLMPEAIKMQGSAIKIAHLQAFRFDSSPTVSVTCKLEICKGMCKSQQCNLLNGVQESWGRKKRSLQDLDNSVTEFETKRYKIPRFAQATTSLVIIDPLQQINDPQPQVSLNKNSPVELANQSPEIMQNVAVAPEGQMCMNKYSLLGVTGTLLLIILVQALVVGKYIFSRLLNDSPKQYY
ncbi:unnamed protein product [Bursaphelenchus okinawaensis]|uniref:Uncharacterized protein n=1 Tax=Bursaphelenchus okinawaensis TaxID=465554 RepID=A0A811JS52_9BILA|nr:unnamed protein product [Bursaphelenchus okinawaensis]CAG9080488.1 unnamed protein product [Bursaphelenchus okinawaensis]